MTEINSEFFFRISVNFHVLFLSVNHLENLPKSKILNLFFFRPLKSFDLIIAYDKDQLGENIINSGVLQITKGNQIPNDFYDIEAIDLSSNSINISIAPKNGQSSYLLLDQFPKEILQLKINMSQGVFLPDITVSENQIKESVVLVEPETNIEQPAECVKTWLSKGNQAACPVITSFSPQTVAAGVRDVSLNGVPGIITINGLNFGDPSAGYLKPYLSDVLFYDVDVNDWFPAAELEYISWSDTKIEMRVPTMKKGGGTFESTGASTGKIKLFTTDFVTGDTCTITSADVLTVQFGMFNDSWKQDILNWEISQGVFSSVTIHGGNRRNLIERNNVGGYDLFIQDLYADTIKNNLAKDQTRKALNVYRCGFKINVKETSIAPDALVKRGPLATGLLGTTMMVGNSKSIICANNSKIDSGIEGFEVIVNEQVLDTLILQGITYMFNLTDTIPSDTISIFYTDLQRTMIHELGHAFQLRHTNNPSDIMLSGRVISPNLRFNNFNRILSPNDTLAINHVYMLSKLGTCSSGAMQDYVCTIGTLDIRRKLNNFHLYPNPASDFINLKMDAQVSQIYVDLLTVAGVKVLERIQSDNNESLKIHLPSTLQNGIYVLRSYDKAGRTISINKFVIQK